MQVNPSVAATAGNTAGAAVAPPAASPARTVRGGVISARSSVSDQFRRRHSWQRILAERRCAVPCWLASFVVHLALAIVLGSLIVPEGKAPLPPLLLSFASAISDVEQSTPAPEPAVVEMPR